MDPELVAHWRYPEGMFRIQAAKYQTFHMTDPQVFYNQEDLWNWAEEVVTGERVPIEPYYVNMRLPGETDAEFVLMMPYTPSSQAEYGCLALCPQRRRALWRAGRLQIPQAAPGLRANAGRVAHRPGSSHQPAASRCGTSGAAR